MKCKNLSRSFERGSESKNVLLTASPRKPRRSELVDSTTPTFLYSVTILHIPVAITINGHTELILQYLHSDLRAAIAGLVSILVALQDLFHCEVCTASRCLECMWRGLCSGFMSLNKKRFIGLQRA